MDGWVGVMPVLRIVVDGWMGVCNARFKDCCGWMDEWVGVLVVLRIAMGGWMGGCNACFKDCYLVKRKFKAATAKNVSSDFV